MGDADTGYAQVHVATLHYEVRGDGPPLTLLHAGVADSRMWDDQFAVFARQYRVVRYDMREYGRTVVPAEPYSHHDDTAQLLSFLGIEETCVMGSSFGGKVAIDLTLAYPQMVSALVLCAPAVGGCEPSSQEMLRFIAEEDEAWERSDMAAATEVNLRMWVDGPNRTPDQVCPGVRERVRQMQLQAFTLDIPEAAEVIPLIPPAITRLSGIDVPTLVIIGDQDVREFIRISEMVADAIPGANREVVPGVARLPNMEEPELFNQIVLDFLIGV